MDELRILHLQAPAYQLDDEDDIWYMDVSVDLGDGEVRDYELNAIGEDVAKAVEKHFRTSINPLTGNDLKLMSEKVISAREIV